MSFLLRSFIVSISIINEAIIKRNVQTPHVYIKTDAFKKSFEVLHAIIIRMSNNNKENVFAYTIISNMPIFDNFFFINSYLFFIKENQLTVLILSCIHCVLFIFYFTYLCFLFLVGAKVHENLLISKRVKIKRASCLAEKKRLCLIHAEDLFRSCGRLASFMRKTCLVHAEDF